MPTSTIYTKAGNPIATGHGPTPEAAEEAAWDVALAAYGCRPSKAGGLSNFSRCVASMAADGLTAVATREVYAAQKATTRASGVTP